MRPSIVPVTRDVVEHRQVLHGLAQPDSAGVRADRHPELRGEQEVRDVLVDPADAGRVDLHDLHAARLEQLLEDDAVLHVLARGHADRRDAARDRGVTEDVVGARRLLDPGHVESASARTHSIAAVDIPPLVRVDRDRVAVGRRLARAMPSRRMSSPRSAPTLSLICANPSATASRHSRASFSSVYPSQPGVVV